MKDSLRKTILNKREALSSNFVDSNSKLIIKTLFESDFYKDAHNVMLFVSFRNEVNTYEIIQDLFLKNKRVFVPLTNPKTKELSVCEIKDYHNDLELGHFGVLEPKKEALRLVSPTILDLIIVPGLVFDERGYRIGYGAGYYDRFLSGLPQVTTVSLAFEMQMVESVPNDDYDIPVKYIITEKRFIKASKE
ncbi:5-formyltetrahydrofolate cyclo-ligase [Alkaliphilus peptidifermentans]|uniref:5-formyltetrahydrofolate cyclo-ligase n=1 Tax=Alkaliphilus peptidifermentans DSM 18978 TaxID=1120976 RepID=A0A1G5GB72_9FIRM|nr:5-formyltetrahydrofolate cyclo-ligase [Alkaliphilus peptidifermentans]SCY48557.1 5-formyltetrahydrofolate cyclo-ligase [Alkaliphilus peptidifermentans DSM 18978]